MISPPSAAYAVLCLVCASCVAVFFSHRILSVNDFREGSGNRWDSLRGILSICLMISHAAVWQQYLEVGRWDLIGSRFYTHLAQTGVVIFFIVSGYLLSRRVLEPAAEMVDWRVFYVGRFLRLTPAYWSSLVIMFFITFLLSDEVGRQSFSVSSYWGWIFYTIPGAPVLLGVEATNVVMCFAMWPLPYLWIFYFSLPLIAFLMGRHPPVILVLVSLLLVIWGSFVVQFYALVWGMVLAGVALFLIKKHWLHNFVLSPRVGWPLLIFMASINVALFKTAYSWESLALLASAVLILVVTRDEGDCWWVRSFRALGAAGYGIFVFHGPVIFAVMWLMARWYPGFYHSHPVYWVSIAGAVFVTVLGAMAFHHQVESPLRRHVLRRMAH